ncbi:metal ABC transporter permease [Persicobacter psychrovividus]|uniref:Manganese transport system membrane protein MntD n=1 Tax=Persicobacter psychrovividus TaxID=387638 RepID=A0ABM7VD73_9BACT|nr:manganese transport system membrane protein MntD [Persicobacter psychrovividus]
MNDLLIILTGACVAVSCSLLGCFLVLRKMTMVADAISHAVLPGIVIAFLLSGSRDSVVMLAGAALFGILTTFIIEFFHHKGGLQSDASIGVTFTWLFAVGVILITVFAGKVDLDQDCVLYGEIAYVPIDLWITDAGTILGPRALWIGAIVMVVIITFISICYKALYLSTFDPAFAAAIGISTTLWHYALMGMVSLVSVASFESVGAILVIALMVTPAATAYLLTHELKKMLIYAAVIGVLTSVLGYYIAYAVDGSIAGAMASVGGLLFMLAFLFSPTDGYISRNKRRTNKATLEATLSATSK